MHEPGYSQLGAYRAIHNGAAKAIGKSSPPEYRDKSRALTSPGIGVIITDGEIYQFTS